MCCCVWFCFAKGHSGNGCLSSSILFKYECRVGHLFTLSWSRAQRVALGSVVSECCAGNSQQLLHDKQNPTIEK